MISTPTAKRVQPAGRLAPSVLAPVLPLSGCKLCSHGVDVAGERWCAHPNAPHAPVHQLRAPGGHCGPEALLLDFPGLRG